MWSDVMQGDVMFCFVKYVLCPFVWCCGSEICSTASLSQDIETDMEQGKDISAEEVERTCKRMHWQLLQTLRQINLIPVVISYINRMKPNVCNMLRATSGYGYLCRLSPIVWIACICLHMPAYACMACMACRMSSSSHFGIFGPGSRTRTELESTSAELEVSAWGK